MCDPNWKENGLRPALTIEEGGGGASACFSQIPADSGLGVEQMALRGIGGAVAGVEAEGGGLNLLE
jgi:hypothetical protein